MNPPIVLTKRLALVMLIGLLLAVFTGVKAQQTPVLQYVARVAPAVSDPSPKPLFVAVVDQLPGCDVMHDRDHNALGIRTTERLSFSQLQSWMQGSGYVLLHLALAGHDFRTHLATSAQMTVPEFTDTGNAAQDEADFQAAVAAWMQAHPMPETITE